MFSSVLRRLATDGAIAGREPLDIPIVYNLATLYRLPLGRGKRFLLNNNVVDRFVGGRDLSGIYHFNSGTPISITASCQLPSQFQALGCYPDVLQEYAILAHSQGELNASIAKGNPVSAFNANAFAGTNLPTPFQYNLTIPTGPLFSGVRGSGYTNLDLSLMKTTHIAGRLSSKLGVQAFDSLKQHSLARTSERRSPLQTSAFGLAPLQTQETYSSRLGWGFSRFIIWMRPPAS